MNVRSHVAGMVTALYCHEGDYVSTGGKIADVVDSRNLLLKIPFLVSDKESLYPGAQAEVTMSDSGFTFYGTVSKLYDTPQAFDGGKEGVMAEISLNNPGAVKAAVSYTHLKSQIFLISSCANIIASNTVSSLTSFAPASIITTFSFVPATVRDLSLIHI